MKERLLLLLTLLLPLWAYAQNAIGVPGITHYTPLQFAADPQIWDISQDAQGILYFANDDGLLTFNGSYWKQYPLPNKSTVKALAIDAAGRIYTGGQDELGYFYPDENGSLRFHSLKQFIPSNERQFADIWDVATIRDEVYFRTNESIFQLKDTTIKAFDAPHQWQLLTIAGGKIFAADQEQGLLVFHGGQWKPACKPLPGLRLTGITTYRHDTLLVSTLQHGLFLLHDSTLKAFPSQVANILHLDRLDATHFAIGTLEDGCYVIDDKGQLVQQFSRKEGLQNNSIQHIFQDRDLHLWLGLKSGIDFVTYHSAVKHIYPDRDNQLTTYTARVLDNNLYIGTSNGLFATALHAVDTDLSTEKGVFTEIAHTKGKAWGLTEIDHQLLLAHSEGVFQVKGNTATPLLSRPGSWTVAAIPASHDLVVGTYTGLHLLQYAAPHLKDGGSVDGLYESLHYLAPEDNTIWASHPYRGVFKLDLAPDHQTIVQNRLFTQNDGLPATRNNYVYTLHGRMVVATEKGVYTYNPATHRFAPDKQYDAYFHNVPLQYVTQDSSGNIWFVSAAEVGVVDVHKPSNGKPFSIVYFPEMSGQMPNDNAFIYPYNRENIFIGSNAGMFHLNYNDYLAETQPVSALVSAVRATAAGRDSLVFGGYAVHEPAANLEDARHGPGFPNKWNSFHFEYSSTQFNKHIQYSYQLQGFDNNWSGWSSKTEKDYTNLPYGAYTFRVRARNNLGNVSAPAAFPFVIRPAWYQTITAFIIYGCLLATLIYYLLNWQESRLTRQQQQRQEEQERQLYLQQLELDRNEKEIISLQKNQLAAQVDFKNKELATVTMLLVERRTLLSKIRDELNKLLKTLQPNISTEFKALLRMLDNAEKGEDDWQQFAIHFDEVHSNFLSTLKKKYPVLSPTDLKLCAYLRINLSSKEIAQLLNISAKSVEVSRYRLRKKLELPTEVNLFDFLLQVTD
ncbi:ligand-binding sensor domain-containing protein [Chitinophaga costaii]|uniref:Ligand-binding sensor domain-containing protein n=1 Tax=Chitinophaga costaii TaxID=1335309 RepID=A0A1C4CKM3_9BACT|nr:triple tyrosine motif-containing protein [Chitinophaga costaii]PUZ27052.1 transcriptional regulator [Chitinophaga costaii]SCC19576.1 ligand-binding sensor domain-containing protein [Chitinophaga costaii]